MAETNVAVEQAALTADEQKAVKNALALLYPLYEAGKLPGAIVAQLGALVGYPAPEGYGYPKPFAYPSPYPCPYPYPVPKAEEQPAVEEAISKAVEELKKSWAEREKEYLDKLAKAESRLAELESALASEREAKERMAALQELKTRFPTISQANPEFLEKLASLRKSETWETMVQMAEALEKLWAQAPLLKEIGENKIETDPLTELRNEAQALVQKGLAPTLEQAMAKVALERRDLYEKLRGGG